MSDSISSSVDPFVDDLTDDMLDDDSLAGDELVSKPLSSRRRLENRLAELSLEKDVREFDFDI